MKAISLPQPATVGKMSVEEAIQKRRSRRSFAAKPLTLEQLGQILWAAQGITEPRRGLRAAPSAGATYPMELYVAVCGGGVEGLEAGVYHYVPQGHQLQQTFQGDVRSDLAAAAFNQGCVAQAPVTVLMAAVPERTSRRYGQRAERYIAMEAGHIGQNIYLQAEALGLGTVAVGAFRDEDVERVFRLPADQHALYMMPVGHPK